MEVISVRFIAQLSINPNQIRVEISNNDLSHPIPNSTHNSTTPTHRINH